MAHGERCPDPAGRALGGLRRELFRRRGLAVESLARFDRRQGAESGGPRARGTTGRRAGRPTGSGLRGSRTAAGHRRSACASWMRTADIAIASEAPLLSFAWSAEGEAIAFTARGGGRRRPRRRGLPPALLPRLRQAGGRSRRSSSSAAQAGRRGSCRTPRRAAPAEPSWTLDGKSMIAACDGAIVSLRAGRRRGQGADKGRRAATNRRWFRPTAAASRTCSPSGSRRAIRSASYG